jgi:glycosyltransferase involved in cell wall biosynthesis
VRICYLSNVLYLHDHRFLRKLTAAGYETWLVAYRNDDIPAQIAEIGGLNIIHVRPRFLRKIQKYLYGAKVFHFRQLLKRIQPDILHSGYVWKDGFLAALSGFHPHLSMPWGDDVLTQPDESRICRCIVKYTLSHADMITCDAERVKEKIAELSGYPPEKIVVFPWGLELGLFNPRVDGSPIRNELGWEENKVLIMNRQMRPKNNVACFIETLPAVVREEPDTRVLLLGSGPMENEIRELVRENALGPFVHFAGWVPIQDMPKYLRASDIYVSSALMDGSSMSLLEAMACGLPVVVTDIPSILEWVDDGYNGYVVPRRNSEALAAKILELLQDQSLGARMSERNVQIARQRADWDKNFATLERMYHRLVASGSDVEAYERE